jgi:hypothetical protein
MPRAVVRRKRVAPAPAVVAAAATHDAANMMMMTMRAIDANDGEIRETCDKVRE